MSGEGTLGLGTSMIHLGLKEIRCGKQTKSTVYRLRVTF
jgi:hypothetical protein